MQELRKDVAILHSPRCFPVSWWHGTWKHGLQASCSDSNETGKKEMFGAFAVRLRNVFSYSPSVAPPCKPEGRGACALAFAITTLLDESDDNINVSSLPEGH